MAHKWKDTIWNQHRADLKTFYAEAGTNEMMCRGRYPVAIKTSEASLLGLIPDKDIPGYSKPDRRTKTGKQLAAKLCSLKTPVPDELLNLITPDRSWIVGNYLCHSAMSSFGGEYFVSVPTEVEYHPHDEMIEMLEWEYLKLETETTN